MTHCFLTGFTAVAGLTSVGLGVRMTRREPVSLTSIVCEYDGRTRTEALDSGT